MHDQGSLLDLIDADPIHEGDRRRIDTAVRSAALEHRGVVSTNDVRKLLTNQHGLTVQPQLIGPRLRTLTVAGVLQLDGWETERRRGREPRAAWVHTASSAPYVVLVPNNIGDWVVVVETPSIDDVERSHCGSSGRAPTHRRRRCGLPALPPAVSSLNSSASSMPWASAASLIARLLELAKADRTGGE